jgi:hypothetical protein
MRANLELAAMVGGALLLAVSITIAWQRAKTAKPLTVEAEQAKAREVTASNAQWAGITIQDDGEDHSDPLYHVIEIARSTNRTLM